MAGAAFANGYAGNGLDIDDGSPYTRGHPGVQLLPAALAVGEAVGVTGKELMRALAIGYEVALLAGRCWHQHHDEYQACGSWGSVGCAAVAAALLGLDREETKHALGIAEYQAPNLPMMRDVDNPAMVKHGIGWGAMNGIMAAGLARSGFTGIPSLLGMERFRDWVSRLGNEWLLRDGLGMKRWCSCGWGHPCLAAALMLQDKHTIDAARIAHITVYTFHHAWRLYQELPSTTEEAQFNVKWPLAALLIYGEVGPDQILEKGLDNETIAGLFDRIEIIEDREINRKFMLAHEGIDSPDALWSSRVVIETDTGERYDSGEFVDTYEWNQERVEEKFRWITGYVFDQEKSGQILHVLTDIENKDSVDEITSMFRKR
jgi:2-methylcitrate dehydratase PrpD